MNLEKLKDTARKFEQKEDWRRAIEVYLKAIQQIESGQETSPDLSLYNRVGDLYLKTNDTSSAVRSYERAVDLYADQGFFNNAIALCGKILRVNPGRTQTYLKLAQLHARKNVVIEAKRNLIEFLERMNALGQLDQAFQSVNEFADQFSGSQEIRLMLVELLRAASREDEAREQLEKLAGEIEGRDRADARRSQEISEVDLDESLPPKARGSLAGLVFLDTGLDLPPRPPRAEEVERIVETPPMVEADEVVAPAEGLILPETVADGESEEVPGLEPAGAMDLGGAELITGGFDDDLGLQPTEEASAEFGGEFLAGIEEPVATVEEEALLTDEADLMVDLAVEPAPAGSNEEDIDLDLVDGDGLAELQDAILDNPDDPALHRRLAEALAAGGEEERALEELELALDGYERGGDYSAAAGVAERLVAIAPDVIRHHQKRGELAFRGGEAGPPLEAFLPLGGRLGGAGGGGGVPGRRARAAPGCLSRAGRRAGAGRCGRQGRRRVQQGAGARSRQRTRRGRLGDPGQHARASSVASSQPAGTRGLALGSRFRSSRPAAACPRATEGRHCRRRRSRFRGFRLHGAGGEGAPRYPHAGGSAGAGRRRRAAGVQGDP